MFFQALVMACSISFYGTPQCDVFDDLYGPYNTKDECEVRVEEMVYIINETRIIPTDYFFKCVAMEGV
tara:strand:- start:833 stop:1036 length:204 start_codon:yes stop_codon:yes gene_type:complete